MPDCAPGISGEEEAVLVLVLVLGPAIAYVRGGVNPIIHADEYDGEESSIRSILNPIQFKSSQIEANLNLLFSSNCCWLYTYTPSLSLPLTVSPPLPPS